MPLSPVAFVPSSESDVTSDFMKTALAEHLPKEAKIVNVESRCVTNSSDRDGFLSQIIKTKFIFQKSEDAPEESLDIVVKMFPKGPDHRKMVRDMNVYPREIHAYTFLAKEMVEAQKENDKEVIWPPIPKVYYEARNLDFAVLVMDDLTAAGYKMVPKRLGLDREHALLATKQLAKFHALSLNMKSRKPLETYMHENALLLRTPLEMFEFSFMEIFPLTMTLVEEQCGRPDLKKRLETYWDKTQGNPYIRYEALLRPRPKMTCLVHGDSWSNNILFKYDDNGKPIDAMLIDLQLSLYAHVTTDLVYIQYNSLSGPTRKRHETELLKTYYETLWEYLAYLGTPGLRKEDYTFEEFMADVQISREYGFLISLVFIPTLLGDEGDLPDFDTMGQDGQDSTQLMEEFLENRRQSKASPLVKERLLDMLEDMVKYGVL